MSKKLVLGITSPGSTPLINEQVNYFRTKGYDIYLMCPKNENIINFCDEEGCTHINIDIVRKISIVKDFVALFQIVIALNKIKPDIVNVGTPKMGLLGILAASLLGTKKRIYTCRGLRYEHESGLKKILLMYSEKLCGWLAHTVFCISPSLKDKALKDKIFSSQKSVIIGKGSSNGINLSKFNPDVVDFNELTKIKKKLELEDCFVYGFVGRLVDRKGISELYEAFTDLYQINTKLRLLIVGTIEKDQLKNPALADKIITHPGIKWVGWQDNIPLHMSLFDVFVLPAWWEGFGTVYIQAAAMGVPVIGSNGTGCRDAVNDGYNGLVIEVGNTQQLKDYMKKYYDDKKLRDLHSENGIQWAQHFRQELIWEGLEKIYLN